VPPPLTTIRIQVKEYTRNASNQWVSVANPVQMDTAVPPTGYMLVNPVTAAAVGPTAALGNTPTFFQFSAYATGTSSTGAQVTFDDCSVWKK
jgi:hypothetical protein